MDKELIDRVWKYCLPKEFKEEVKKEYLVHHESGDMKYSYGYNDALTDFFGHHNLTSDAEGEEMLTVSREKVQEMYALNEDILFLDSTHTGARLLKAKLQELFGSKCLPDETCNVASSDVASSESKPAEPKFKVGDKIRIVKGGVFYDRIGEVTDIDFVCHLAYYKTDRSYEWLKESDLEPYTEPTNEGTRQERCVPKNAESGTRSFDTILKDSFSKERRLNIAAMAMQGILANAAWTECKAALAREAAGGNDMAEAEILTKELAEDAAELADALIKEVEKGGLNESAK